MHMQNLHLISRELESCYETESLQFQPDFCRACIWGILGKCNERLARLLIQIQFFFSAPGVYSFIPPYEDYQEKNLKKEEGAQQLYSTP